MIDLSDPRVASRHQYRTRPCGERRVDVAADIADHQALIRSDSQLVSGRRDQAWLRLTAPAARIGRVRTDLPGVERTEQLFHARIDLRQFIGVDQAPGDPGLVTDHANGDTLTAQLIERTPSARHRPDPVRIGQIGHIFDQGAVPIEEHRARPFG